MKTITRKWSLNLNYAYLSLLLLLSISSYSQEEVQCGSDAYFQTIRLRQNVPGEGQDGDFVLYRVDPVAVTFTFVANLSVSDGPDDFAVPNNSSVNSLGINPDDRQFYFINPSSPYQCYRMTGTGDVTYLGNLTGEISGSNVAGVFDKEGNYYVTGGSKKLFQVDLNTLETTKIMNTGINVSDIAINPDNDLIYGWDQGKRQLNIIDIANESVTAVGPEPNTSEFGTFGALYFLPSGQLIGYGDNTTIPGGQEALVDFNPETGFVTQLGTGPAVSVNDGASCPFTLAIDKDGPETAGLNTTITYTFSIFNRTAEVLHNIFFQDVLQSGLVFNSNPYNISTGMTIFGTSNGQTQTDLVLNNVPIGITTFQIDVFIDCDFPDMEILNQAIIGIDNLDNPISSNDTDTAVIGDPTGTGIQPLELVFPEEVIVEGCTESAVTSESSIFVFSTDESGNVATQFNDAEGYEILPGIDNVVELTYVDAISADSNACGVIIERTFSATDNCGRSVEQLQIIKVIDSLAPVANEIPEELTINCDEYDPQAPVTPFTAQDNCSGIIEGVFTDVVTDGDCASTFTVSRSWSFVDDCGNESVSVQTINVVDTTPPVFDLPLPGDITADCNALPELNLLTATDNCGEVSVEVIETSAPDSCGIVRTWTATDACGNSTQFSQTITVVDNEPPVFVLTDEEDACHTQLENGAFEAIQFNGIITFQQIQQENIPGWSTTASHNTIEIQRSGQIDGSPSHNGNFHFELNGQGLDDLYQSFCTVPESELTIRFFHRKRRVNNTVDSMELFAGSDLNNLTSLGVFEVTNADGWKENIVNYSVPAGQETTMILFQALTGSTPSVGNLLDDISVSSDQNNFAELPQDITVECDEIPQPEILTAEDNCGNATVVFEEEIVYVDDTTNDRFIIENCFASEVIEYNPASTSSGGSIPEDRTDPEKALGEPDGNNEAGGFVSLGIGGSITLKMGAPVYDAAGNDIAIAETSFGPDGCTNNNSESALVEVSQDGETWFSLGEICRDAELDISSAELEFVLYIRITDTTTGGGDGFDVDGVSTLNGCGENGPSNPENCSDYSIVRTWTAEDFCGNSVSHTQTITVVDNEAPVFNENLPNDVTVDCDNIPNASNLTAFDSCSDATVEFEEVISDEDACNYVITRTWIASDSCGNSREHVQTITVIDETAPTLNGELEETVSAECGEIPEVPELDFVDNCSENVEVVFTEDDSQSNTFNDFEIYRTWVVTDECGNSAEFNQTVNVQIVNTIEAFDARICNTEGIVDLFSYLQGEFDTNGVWTVVSGASATVLSGSSFNAGAIEEDIIITFNYALTDVSCPVERNLNITVDNCAVLSCEAEDVEISKAVTANGDGFNEFFTVEGIEDCGFVIEVEIYNRWGAKVYKSSDYQNDWSGQNSGSTVGGSDTVPTGTYYYVVNLRNSGLDPFAGPIYVATNK